MNRRIIFIALTLTGLLALGIFLAVRSSGPDLHENGVVASECALASRVGKEILQRGGNAVDAAVATALALAVTFPAAGNIGGGGFLLARLPDGSARAFDFREKAPLASREGMFLGPDGTYDSRKHHWSILSVGVPGSVA